MNTVFFRRGPKSQNPVMAMLELARRPFGKLQQKHQELPTDCAPSPTPLNGLSLTNVRLSPGTYRLREENTTLTDRQSALRFVVARCLGISMDLVNDQTVLSGAGLSRQSLLDLVAATDLEFGVYVEPELFGPDFTFSRLSDLVFKTGVKDRDHDEE